MNYEQAFTNFAAKALDRIDPTEVGKSPHEVNINSELSVADQLRVGSIAGAKSERLLDNKEHFPVVTEIQARSSMARVLQLSETPVWYKGTINDLRQEVYAGIMAVHPNIVLNVRVPVEQTVALSDGETPSETSEQSVKDPNADRKHNEVPQVSRPTLTSAQVELALNDEETRKAISGRLMEMVDQQIEHLNSAKKLATRLLKSGVKSEEFDQLSTYLQEDILRELMSRGATASADVENRRRELLDRMNKNNG